MSLKFFWDALEYIMCEIRLRVFFLLQKTKLYTQYDWKMYKRDLEEMCKHSFWVKVVLTCDSGHLYCTSGYLIGRDSIRNNML